MVRLRRRHYASLGPNVEVQARESDSRPRAAAILHVRRREIRRHIERALARPVEKRLVLTCEEAIDRLCPHERLAGEPAGGGPIRRLGRRSSKSTPRRASARADIPKDGQSQNQQSGQVRPARGSAPASIRTDVTKRDHATKWYLVTRLLGLPQRGASTLPNRSACIIRARGIRMLTRGALWKYCRHLGNYPRVLWLASDVGDHLVLLRCRFQDLGGKKSGTVAGSTPGICLLGSGGAGVRL